MIIYVDTTPERNIWYAVKGVDALWFRHTTNPEIITLNTIELFDEIDNSDLYIDIIATAGKRDVADNTKYYLSPANNPMSRDGWEETSCGRY